MFLDLDQFKLFNDSYGHTRGDEVLRRVAQTLDETFRRGGDLVARYGGEEFAVVLPGVDGRRAGLYAERLRRRIWRLAIPYNASQLTDRVTISGGVATIYPPATVGPDELLFAADKALYRAKCLGRNRIATAEVQTAGSQVRLQPDDLARSGAPRPTRPPLEMPAYSDRARSAKNNGESRMTDKKTVGSVTYQMPTRTISRNAAYAVMHGVVAVGAGRRRGDLRPFLGLEFRPRRPAGAAC